MASTNLVRSSSTLDPTAALALAEEMRRSFFFATALALQAATTNFLSSIALVFESFAVLVFHLDLSFDGAANSGARRMRAVGSMDLAFL